ncbi:ATP-binding protein [Streptomyces sp. NPDC050504]|uniref:ATP-binding protein n=1 Tax=Streptomyces sp. NPDC050504 TaxID=3365618 RepID=UPI00378D0103
MHLIEGDPPGPAVQYGMDFTVGEHSARHVRRIVRTYLRLWEMDDLVEAAELGITELLANVVRHVPGRHCAFQLLRRPEGLRVEVWDSSPVLPVPRTAGPLDERGRGLVLVESVTARWGAERSGTGKTVWFECTCKNHLPGA